MNILYDQTDTTNLAIRQNLKYITNNLINSGIKCKIKFGMNFQGKGGR